MYEVYTICGVIQNITDSIEVGFQVELAQIQAESIGWIPLDEGVCLHLGSSESSENTVIEVVGLPKPEMQITQQSYVSAEVAASLVMADFS